MESVACLVPTDELLQQVCKEALAVHLDLACQSFEAGMNALDYVLHQAGC